MEETRDFDAEALALFQRLGIDPATAGVGEYNPLDALYRAPSGGTVYVGNQIAAQHLAGLQQLGITHVVNATHGMSAIPNYHQGRGLKYFTFEIAAWGSHVGPSDESLRAFVAPLFAFIDAALARGESVLVHCLAGAHRAGTTGVAVLMHYARLDVDEAIATAKRLRRVIDPIGRLPDFLRRLRRAQLAAGSGGGGAGLK